MKLIVIRHGLTIQNEKHICQGQSEGQLSETGIEQAKKLGLRFKDTKIDALYSSDLQRTQDTSKEILKFHPELKMNLDKRLRERNFGKYENNLLPADWDWKNFPQGVETNEQVCERVKKFIDDIYPKHKNETVFVVSHGGTKRGFLAVIENKSDFNYLEKIGNTAVTEFNFKETGNHELVLLNCTKHLE